MPILDNEGVEELTRMPVDNEEMVFEKKKIV
jgi:hypothetical protein